MSTQIGQHSPVDTGIFYEALLKIFLNAAVGEQCSLGHRIVLTRGLSVIVAEIAQD